MVQLSQHQEKAMKALLDWYKGPDQVFVLGGYAGTGKSTLASQLIEHVDGSVHFCAYTGKAASVLCEKGVSATTIHQAIYLPKAKTSGHLSNLKKLLEAETDPEKIERLKNQIQIEENDKSDITFSLNPESILLDADLTVVDEYSMLDEKIVNDLIKSGKKILALGDPGQLPPIRGKCPWEPDHFLTEVHRQALDSPILKAATLAREGKFIPFERDNEFFMKVSSKELPWEEYRDADQVIVARNKTRINFNNRFRKLLGMYDKDNPLAELPRKGDKMICTKNNRELGLFNGQIGFATDDAKPSSESSIDLFFEGQEGIPVWSEHFFNPDAKPEIWQMKEFNQFDYAYAITCHKSQGSEFDTVVVYDEGFPRDYEKWLYTACTRAKKRLIIVSP